MSSDPRTVARNRLAYSVNMWRDYESEQGAAVETFPGFRRLQAMREDNEDIYTISGLWHFKGRDKQYLIVQKYNKIYVLNMDKLDGELGDPIYDGVDPNGATSFTINNNLYLVSNQNGTGYPTHMIVINEDDSGKIHANKVEEFYVPTTYYNGKPYEQRNALGSTVIQIETSGGIEDSERADMRNVSLYDKVEYKNSKLQIDKVIVDGNEYTEHESNAGNGTYFIVRQAITFPSGTSEGYAEVVLQFSKQSIYNPESKTYKKIEIKYKAEKTQFNTIGNLTRFQNDKISMAEAILGCTKSAVYDGRVFLTGNPELPNTVFYSQRNITGANDPTYFGAYNYFNDGDGNTPNVDLLSTPSMLMVIKGDTTQDGSVYYHTAQYNTDEGTKDLVPKIYPSTQGAAGLGSAAKEYSSSLACNFLDDPVFLSKRGGLEGVSKEQLNAERTLGHRSSNVDRLLVNEDLANASIAEWKGYLVICCNGHVYLADSRAVSQHRDGSYQYEWFYLEGVGTYENYVDTYYTLNAYPKISVPSGLDETYQPTAWEDVSLSEFYVYMSGERTKLSDAIKIDSTSKAVQNSFVLSTKAYYSGLTNVTIDVNYIETNGSLILVDTSSDEREGAGEFYGAKRVLAVGDLLFFATDFDICVFNTDKRGEDGRIPSEWYSFNGVAYKSACATRLDDCDKKSLTKNTLYGTTAARFKMVPGSRCKVRGSVNGRDWEDVGEAHSSRMDFSDIRFDDFAFAEDEDDVTVLPELSRGWVHKQYYFYSDGFCEPFGLYELSYIYKIAGKIRYI